MNRVDNRLDIASEAVVFGGFTEGSDMMDPLRRALCEGEHALFNSVADVSPNVADIQTNPDDYLAMIDGKTLVAHSLASVIALDDFVEWRKNAKGLILLNPVEPSGKVRKTLWRAKNVGRQKENNAENEDFVPPMSQGPKELSRHKARNLRNIKFATHFSTMKAIAQAPGGSFNGGVGYFEYDADEFKFQDTNVTAVEFLRKLSYDAARFEGKHLAPVYRPGSTAAQLRAYLESTN